MNYAEIALCRQGENSERHKTGQGLITFMKASLLCLETYCQIFLIRYFHFMIVKIFYGSAGITEA